MKNQRLVLPLSISNKAYLIEAEIRLVRNKKNQNFGKVKIYTDMQYNPLVEHEDFKDYMSFEEAKDLLKKLGFIEVSEGFNQNHIESIRTIKSHLSPDWIENYNLWLNYQG
jgi:hypothetical protein